jgi:streptomycin 6-kinase
VSATDLEVRVRSLAARWDVVLEAPFGPTPGSPGNFVAPGRRADGTACVLKVSRAIADIPAEAAALSVWNGRGAARLLEAALDKGGLLLERVLPGEMLAVTARRDHELATHIAAGLLRRLWQPAVETKSLIPLASWCAAYDRNRSALSSGVPGFPGDLFERSDALRADLLASTEQPVVLHGDLHHFNVLRSNRADWLAIDPKGLTGDRCFDVCQFLMNPDAVPIHVNRRRLDVFCEDLNLDPVRTRQWCLVHAVLNACWSFEDGKDVRPAVAYALQFR